MLIEQDDFEGFINEDFIHRDDITPRDYKKWCCIEDWMIGLQEAINEGEIEKARIAIDELCTILECKYIIK